MELSGRVALVTGATSGIGWYTARGLARQGATVFLTGRGKRRGEAAEWELRAAAKHTGVHFIRADASSVGANQALADEVAGRTERRFLGSEACARSKLLNVMWTFALARRLAKSGMIANALHPGLAWTSMTASTEPSSMPATIRMAWPLVRWKQRRGSAEQAARTPLFLAGAPEAAELTGLYLQSDARPGKVPPAARDIIAQERAWELAESLAADALTAQPGAVEAR